MGRHTLNEKNESDPMFPPFRGDLMDDVKNEVERTEGNNWFGADQQG